MFSVVLFHQQGVLAVAIRFISSLNSRAPESERVEVSSSLSSLVRMAWTCFRATDIVSFGAGEAMSGVVNVNVNKRMKFNCVDDRGEGGELEEDTSPLPPCRSRPKLGKRRSWRGVATTSFRHVEHRRHVISRYFGPGRSSAGIVETFGLAIDLRWSFIVRPFHSLSIDIIATLK